MYKGWSAEGRLAPLWHKVGGRDGLAEKTGILGPTLSGYNSGRLPLGIVNARRIAEVLEVTLFELGAPEGAADTEAGERPLLDRLAAAEALGVRQAKLIRDLTRRLTKLEAALPQQGTGRRAQADQS